VPEWLGILLPILGTGVVTFVATWAVMVAQRDRKRLTCDVISRETLVPFETTRDDDLQVLVRRSIVEPEFEGADELVPSGRIYVFIIRLMNRERAPLDLTTVGVRLHESSRIISAEITDSPLGYPDVAVTYAALRSQVSFAIPYLKTGEGLTIALLSVRSLLPSCEIFVPQGDVEARHAPAQVERVLLYFFVFAVASLLVTAVGSVWGLSRYGLNPPRSVFYEDGFVGTTINVMQNGGIGAAGLSAVGLIVAGRRRMRALQEGLSW
jgi:hypothetical protein